MMKNSKNKRTAILAIILLALLVLAYKIIFVSSNEDLTADQNIEASQRVEGILQEVDRINFDMSILQDQKFQSLKSIEIPLLSLPVGRKNPFSVVGSN
jgi:hypothetical protein